MCRGSFWGIQGAGSLWGFRPGVGIKQEISKQKHGEEFGNIQPTTI